jgi:hypothetical protein
MAMFSSAYPKDDSGINARSGSAARSYMSDIHAPIQSSRRRDCKFDATSAKVRKGQILRDRLFILGDRK